MGSQAAIGNVIQNKALTEMAMGYARSRVLCAAARLEIADALGTEERSLVELSTYCSADPDSLYRLLRALASFGIVAETAPKRFVLMPLGDPLRRDAPDSQWPAIVFWADLIADSWSHLTECVRTGSNAMQIMQRDGLPSRWAKDTEAMSIFGAVMGTAPAEDYMPIVRAWDFSDYHTVADLGGGEGALLEAALHTYPKLQGMLVERPHAIERAMARFQSNGQWKRCNLISADLLKNVPEGADVYILKHVMHGMTDETATTVLRNCLKVLPKGGRVLVIEFVLPDVVDHADQDLEQRLMSDLNMLAVTGGKERNAAQWKQLLLNAGLECQGIITVSGELASIIEATPRR